MNEAYASFSKKIDSANNSHKLPEPGNTSVKRETFSSSFVTHADRASFPLLAASTETPRTEGTKLTSYLLDVASGRVCSFSPYHILIV